MNNYNYPICTILGKSNLYFSYSNDDCINFKKNIYTNIEEIYKSGVKDFFCNCERGAAMWSASSVISLREIYRDVGLHLIIPFEEQANNWSDSLREEYFKIHELADSVKILKPNEYDNNKRNEYCEKYMIDRSTVLLTDRDNILIPYSREKGVKIIIYDN